MSRVYCAGPLFNDAERAEMANIAAELEKAGHSTFLPQRDGLEFARILPDLERAAVDSRRGAAALQRAIFSLDIYHLLEWSDAVVANLNGRVPDEGTIVEASLAWHASKALVLYKNDARSLLEGADNPMLTGLGNFHTVSDLQQLSTQIALALNRPRDMDVAGVLAAGKRIATSLRSKSTETVVEAILRLFG
jgi:nucleoside 2-deoxyribosyltransferase